MRLALDFHMHSTHSCDAEDSIEEMCFAALERGLTAVCFTEHVDLDSRDPRYGHFRFDRYSADIDRARRKFDGALSIFKGIEFGEPHLHPREYEEQLRKDYDFIMGSVHNWGESWAGDLETQKKLTVERIFELHYAEVLKTVRLGGFDTLGHIDFPKRYLPRTSEPDAMLAEILGELIRRDITLEINTSPLRNGCPDPFPSSRILDLYIRNGGSMVTVGSDAHSCDQIGADFDRIEEGIVTHGLIVIGFRKRKRFRVRQEQTENSRNGISPQPE